jgi:hypothetical protein
MQLGSTFTDCVQTVASAFIAKIYILQISILVSITRLHGIDGALQFVSMVSLPLILSLLMVVQQGLFA